MRNLRWPILLFIPLVLTALAFWQLDMDEETDAMQVRSSSLTWFCPAISQNNAFKIMNPLTEPVTIRITIYSSILEGGANLEESVPYLADTYEINAPAQATEEINMKELFQDSVISHRPADVARISGLLDSSAVFISVLAEFSKPGPAVDSNICTNITSNQWFIPFASTARDACYFLVIFNPFSSPAVLDVEFATDEGRRFPYEGKVVPARSSLVLNVGSKVTRREHISTSLSTRTGRVIVSKYLTFTGAPEELERSCPHAPYPFDAEGARLWGSQILVGAPQADASWYFPTGIASSHSGSYIIYNPDRENSIEVRMRLFPNAGSELTRIFIIPPSQRMSIQLKDSSLHPKPSFPEPASLAGFSGIETGHWALFESEGEFVAEKLMTLVQVEDGISGKLGLTRAEEEILIYTDALNFDAASGTAFYAIVNPSAQTIARVSIPSAGLNIEVGPRRRFILSLTRQMLPEDDFLYSSAPVLGEPFS